MDKDNVFLVKKFIDGDKTIYFSEIEKNEDNSYDLPKSSDEIFLVGREFSIKGKEAIVIKTDCFIKENFWPEKENGSYFITDSFWKIHVFYEHEKIAITISRIFFRQNEGKAFIHECESFRCNESNYRDNAIYYNFCVDEVQKAIRMLKS